MAADQATLSRLAKICGLFASDQLGERAAAAQRAEALRLKMGVSWADLFAGVADDEPRYKQVHFDPSYAQPAALLARCAPVLTAWEREFLASIGSQRAYTRKQTERLEVIRNKCSTWWANGGREWTA